MRIEDSVSGYLTYNFASQHMKSARIFALQSKTLEEQHYGDEFGAFFEDVRSYVSSTIILSVCALEANINEQFYDRNGVLKEFTDTHRENIFNIIERQRILDKYQLGLLLNKRNPLLFDKEPFESIQYLIRFRDLMVHYKPESDLDFKYSKNLEKKLRTKIHVSPFPDSGAGYLTMKAMSYSCAKWAVNTVLEFSKEYSDLLQIQDKLSSITLL
jgi:hypothetical protein